MRHEVRHALEIVRDADEAWTPPTSIAAQVLQFTVIEAGAAAESPARRVERDERHEDEIEVANAHRCPRIHRFEDAEDTASHGRVVIEADELHTAASLIGDSRQVELAAAPSGQSDQCGHVGFVPDGLIHSDAFARTQ